MVVQYIRVHVITTLLKHCSILISSVLVDKCKISCWIMEGWIIRGNGKICDVKFVKLIKILYIFYFYFY